MNLDFPEWNTKLLKSDPNTREVFEGRMLKDLDVAWVGGTNLRDAAPPVITMERGDNVYVTTTDGVGFIHFMSFAEGAFHYRAELPEKPGVVEIMEEL